ncbi:PSS2 [Scenedesmus sp. PABB004]|nr:PSS2 [Scenedesmus sp. PABB004]
MARQQRRQRQASEDALQRLDPQTAFLYAPHTVSVLLAGLAALGYSADVLGLRGGGGGSSTAAGVWAAVLVFLGYSVVQGPATSMVRPHPAVWRLVHGAAVLYVLGLVVMLFQSADGARALLKHVSPELGVPVVDRDYGTSCALRDAAGRVNWAGLAGALDAFVVAHSLGWWAKALLLRNAALLWAYSIAFELLEATFAHMMPNFNECWWDSWLLDVAICNAVGIYAGMATVRWLECRYTNYDWQGISELPGRLQRAQRCLEQLLPYSWSRLDWMAFSSPARCLQACGLVGVFLGVELNVFFLKHALWVPPTHPLNTARLLLWLAVGAPAVRQYYELISPDPPAPAQPSAARRGPAAQHDGPPPRAQHKLGAFAWLACAMLALETMAAVKFGRGMYPQPWPTRVLSAPAPSGKRGRLPRASAVRQTRTTIQGPLPGPGQPRCGREPHLRAKVPVVDAAPGRAGRQASAAAAGGGGAGGAGSMAAAGEAAFASYDITLNDRELDDFLSFVENQNGGCTLPPQLPDAALDFPGLQLLPHTDSPSHSSSGGSESIGVQRSAGGAGGGAVAAADHTSASGPGEHAADAADDACGLGGGEEELASMMDLSSARLPALDVDMLAARDMLAVKLEQPDDALGALALGAGAAELQEPAPGAGADAAGLPYAALHPGASLLPGWPPGGVDGGGTLPLNPVVFVQGPPPPATRGAARQASLAAGARPSGSGGSSRGSGGRAGAAPAGGEGVSSGAGKAGAGSHSSVEKQRRDRLNSLIDELSDIVPPGDPKYGADSLSASVRRPKHVVLADTIALLRAMQTKLAIEEAEITTLKHQAAAVAAMAAAQQSQQAAHQQELAAATAAAAAAAAVNGAVPSPLARGGGAGAGAGTPALPLAPACRGGATGVLVEAGVDNCLFVKVNCKDRKGLLGDVVGALKAFPVVIATAAITTTTDGTVHDVFEVRIEDESVTAEDIQCAVHSALFAGERGRGKRLRQEAAC